MKRKIIIIDDETAAILAAAAKSSALSQSAYIRLLIRQAQAQQGANPARREINK